MAFTPSLTYKGRPLVRCGNDIYYGSMHDPYVVYLQVLTTKKEGNADVADKMKASLCRRALCARPTRPAVCSTP